MSASPAAKRAAAQSAPAPSAAAAVSVSSPAKAATPAKATAPASAPKPATAPAPAPAAPAAAAATDSFWDLDEPASKPQQQSNKKQTSAELFGTSAASPDFMAWCQHKLKAFNASIDTESFVSILNAFDSRQDVTDYSYEFLGRSSEVAAFAKEFCERRRPFETVAGKRVAHATAAASAQPAAAAAAPQGKKKRAQKLHPSALGFSVNSSQLTNRGEVHQLDDM